MLLWFVLFLGVAGLLKFWADVQNKRQDRADELARIQKRLEKKQRDENLAPEDLQIEKQREKRAERRQKRRRRY